MANSLIDNPTLFISIIGPRSCGLAGHDIDNEMRINIRNKLTQKLTEYKKNYNIIGLTSLHLGIEQDFALVCMELDIDYIVYSAYDNPENAWKNLPSYITDRYNLLKKSAYDYRIISTGKYSPKKILNNKIQMINDASIIFIMSNHLLPDKNNYLIDYIKINKKTTYEL